MPLMPEQGCTPVFPNFTGVASLGTPSLHLIMNKAQVRVCDRLPIPKCRVHWRIPIGIAEMGIRRIDITCVIGIAYWIGYKSSWTKTRMR